MSDGQVRRPAVIVLAKSPVAGRVKTRCTPPCTPAQAAELAEAALRDTLRIVLAVPAGRHVVVLDGQPGGWLPSAVEVIPPRPGSLGERLDSAFADVGGPALLIGMDTPQVDVDVLSEAVARLASRPSEAIVGPADDGGFWAVGLSAAPPGLFAEVAMSRDDTCRSLLRALAGRSTPWTLLPDLPDFDDFETASEIARSIPASEFAMVVGRINATFGRDHLQPSEV